MVSPGIRRILIKKYTSLYWEVFPGHRSYSISTGDHSMYPCIYLWRCHMFWEAMSLFSYQLHGDRMCKGGCQRLGEGGSEDWMLNEYNISFVGNQNVLPLDEVMDAQHCKCTKCHWVYSLKWLPLHQSSPRSSKICDEARLILWGQHDPDTKTKRKTLPENYRSILWWISRQKLSIKY